MRTISALPGTESVEADLTSGIVTITGTTPIADITNAIKALGFGVKDN